MSGNDRQEHQKRFRKTVSLWGGGLKKDENLTSTDKLVGLHIAEAHLNSLSCRAWPANATVAVAVQLDARTVQRAVNKLARLGYWKIERRRGRSNLYVFTAIAEAMARRGEDAAGDGQACPGGQTAASGNGRQARLPNLKKEHIKESGCAERAPLVSKHRFGPSSAQARAWEKALAEHGLGSLDDYAITEAIQGEPDYVMPSLWPPSEAGEWELVGEYLKRRRKTK